MIGMGRAALAAAVPYAGKTTRISRKGPRNLIYKKKIKGKKLKQGLPFFFFFFFFSHVFWFRFVLFLFFFYVF